jgi:hypothetical protein
MIPVVPDPGCKASEQRPVVWDFVFLSADVAKERNRPHQAEASRPGTCDSRRLISDRRWI